MRHTEKKNTSLWKEIEDNRKYPMQKCQDDSVNQKFRVLHKQIVNAVIQFCKENNIMIDEFNLYADGLEDSIKHGKWCPSTDSSFRMDESLERDVSEFYITLADRLLLMMEREPDWDYITFEGP
jgi:hypothetical protein